MASEHIIHEMISKSGSGKMDWNVNGDEVFHMSGKIKDFEDNLELF